MPSRSLFSSWNASLIYTITALTVAALLAPDLSAAPQRSRPGPKGSVVREAPVEFVAPLAEPVIPLPSRLRSLKSVRDKEDRCEVLLEWLESGVPDTATMRGYRPHVSNEAMVIFRDQPMIAVFGVAYDRMDTGDRIEQHEKVISKCLEGSRPRRVPFVGTIRPDKTMVSLAQQMAPFRSLLDGAFLGQSGQFAPVAIIRHVEQFRAQSAWVKEAIAAASAAEPSRETFDRLSEQRASIGARMGLFSADERKQVSDYIASRQSAIAPAVADQVLAEAGRAAPGVASAATIASSYSAITPIVGALPGPARTAWLERYNHLLDSMVADALKADLARLARLEPSLAGVPQLVGWKTQFDKTFGALSTVPAVQAAASAYNAARERTYGAALRSWREQIDTMSPDASAIVVKRRALDGLFPTEADRSDTWFAQFETPLRAKEDQVRVTAAAAAASESQRRQELAEAAANAAGSAAAGANGAIPGSRAGGAALTSSSLATGQVNDVRTIQSFYTGDFVQIDFNRDDLRFHALYGAYLRAYSSVCARFLPANKVELTNQECATERVTRNGYGMEISRYCIDWVTVPTGTFVTPAMYEGHEALMKLARADGFRTAARLMTDRNVLATASGMVNAAQTASADMEALTRDNACGGPALKRFEENLRRFALNQSPVRLSGVTKPVASINTVVPGLPFRDQNYLRLMQDLVAEQAKTWVMNRFGRVTDASVTSRDAAGRPSRLSARYVFQGFNGSTTGSVDVTFTDGLPECLYFFDASSVCRSPARRIVVAYDAGSYEKYRSRNSARLAFVSRAEARRPAESRQLGSLESRRTSSQRQTAPG